MSRHDQIKVFQNITDGAMTGATVITSTVTNIQFLDNIGLQFVWSGSPTGNFQVQVSANYDPKTNNAGSWSPLTFTYWNGSSFITDSNLPTSLGSPYFLDISLTSAPWLRVLYTNGSGTGTLQGYITAKGL